MNNELTNLLPIDRQRALSREYFLRLGVVATILIMLLTVVAGLLLVPTYVFLLQSTAAKKANLVSIESALSSEDEKTLAVHLTTLTSNTTALLEINDTTSVSMILRTVLTVSRPGILLSGFTYTPATEKTSETLAIVGVAKTRDALRSYQLALQNASFSTEANLPVSAYAKDVNITFTITVTLAS